MNSTIHVEHNDGIVSIGKKSLNVQKKNIVYQKSNDINWEDLNKEINILKSSSDLSIRKFADEATEPVETKNKKSILNVLAKWLPCVGNLIESSYYIIEIAKNFGIKIG